MRNLSVLGAASVAALAAGATSILEPIEQSWGDRTCGVVDPFDNRWWVATHLREFS